MKLRSRRPGGRSRRCVARGAGGARAGRPSTVRVEGADAHAARAHRVTTTPGTSAHRRRQRAPCDGHGRRPARSRRATGGDWDRRGLRADDPRRDRTRSRRDARLHRGRTCWAFWRRLQVSAAGGCSDADAATATRSLLLADAAAAGCAPSRSRCGSTASRPRRAGRRVDGAVVEYASVDRRHRDGDATPVAGATVAGGGASATTGADGTRDADASTRPGPSTRQGDARPATCASATRARSCVGAAARRRRRRRRAPRPRHARRRSRRSLGIARRPGVLAPAGRRASCAARWPPTRPGCCAVKLRLTAHGAAGAAAYFSGARERFRERTAAARGVVLQDRRPRRLVLPAAEAARRAGATCSTRTRSTARATAAPTQARARSACDDAAARPRSPSRRRASPSPAPAGRGDACS